MAGEAPRSTEHLQTWHLRLLSLCVALPVDLSYQTHETQLDQLERFGTQLERRECVSTLVFYISICTHQQLVLQQAASHGEWNWTKLSITGANDWANIGGIVVCMERNKRTWLAAQFSLYVLCHSCNIVSTVDSGDSVTRKHLKKESGANR